MFSILWLLFAVSTLVSVSGNVNLYASWNSTSNCSGTDCASPACPCPTIQAAINAVNTTNTVITINLIPGGIFTGPGNTNLTTSLTNAYHFTCYNKTEFCSIELNNSFIDQGFNSASSLRLSYLQFSSIGLIESPIVNFTAKNKTTASILFENSIIFNMSTTNILTGSVNEIIIDNVTVTDLFCAFSGFDVTTSTLLLNNSIFSNTKATALVEAVGDATISNCQFLNSNGTFLFLSKTNLTVPSSVTIRDIEIHQMDFQHVLHVVGNLSASNIFISLGIGSLAQLSDSYADWSNVTLIDVSMVNHSLVEQTILPNALITSEGPEFTMKNFTFSQSNSNYLSDLPVDLFSITASTAAQFSDLVIRNCNVDSLISVIHGATARITLTNVDIQNVISGNRMIQLKASESVNIRTFTLNGAQFNPSSSRGAAITLFKSAGSVPSAIIKDINIQNCTAQHVSFVTEPIIGIEIVEFLAVEAERITLNISNIGAMQLTNIASANITSLHAHNISRLTGSVLSALSVHSFTFTDTLMENTQVGGALGLIFLYDSVGDIQDFNCTNNGDPIQTLSGPSSTPIKAILSNITISNSEFFSYAPFGGGIFGGDSSIYITDCIFKNSHSYVGGAMFFQHSNVTLDNILVLNCTSLQDGGGIYSSNSTIHIYNGLFDGNRAMRYGGAVRSRGDLAGIIYTNQTIFTHNEALEGAAIYVDGKGTSVVNNCSFSNNDANSSGGAIAGFEYSRFNISDSAFHNNSALSLGGAVIFAEFSFAIVSNCTISHNIATTAGGGIFVQDMARLILSNITVNFNFALEGGGILFDSSTSLFITDSLFQGNIVNSTGGGIAVYNKALFSIHNSRVENNTALSGAGLWIEGSVSLVMEHCSIYSNIATSRGGGLLMGENSGGTIFHSHFHNNTGNYTGGGAIWIQDQAFPTISFCNLTNNRAANGGALVSTSSYGPTVKNCWFHENYCDFNGGAISLQYSNSTFIECNCTNNYSQNKGGCATIADQAAPLMRDIYIANNKALGVGGGISCLDNSGPQIMDSMFLNNSGSLGGAFFSDFDITGYIHDTLFKHNYASSGGGMYNKGSSISFSNLEFIENSAATAGGAITFVLNTPLEEVTSPPFTNTTLRGNQAGFLGGALYILPSSTNSFSRGNVSLFSGIELSDNSAHYGGGVCLETTVIPPKFSAPVTFTNNTALKMGGAIFVNSLYNTTSYWLEDAAFANNSALWAGSTTAWEILKDTHQTDIFCKNCSFISNRSNGYQTSEGFATYPLELEFTQHCPISTTLDATPFSISLSIYDQLGNLVRGNMIQDVGLNVTLNSSCIYPNGIISQPINPLLGVALFNVTLQGRNNDTCMLEMGTVSNEIIRIKNQSCGVLLYGCNSDERVASGGQYDYCKNVVISPTVLLWLVISSLVILIILVISLIGFSMARKYWKKKRRLQSIMMPLFKERPNVTLENILNDPGIERIDWKDISEIERIGVGAVGLVSKAMLNKNGEMIPIAMKELLVGLELLDESVIKEFLVEIKLMSALAHPNIVKFLGVTCRPELDKLLLVTELMELGSVGDLMEQHPNMEFKDRIELMIGAAKGIEYLHNNKLIHRDIKPHNLLVNSKMECKIADFGISTVMPEFTRTMTCVGTPVYMAPEVLSLEKYSAKADVYSFGILLLEIITNLRPYSIGEAAGLGNPVLMHRIVEKGLRPEHGPLPEPLQQLVDECIDGRPDFRPSFDEIVTRLQRLKSLDVDIFDILMYSRKLEHQQQRLSSSSIEPVRM